MPKLGKTAQGVFHGGVQKKHYCPEHDKACQIVTVSKKWRARYDCPQGCQLNRQQVVLK